MGFLARARNAFSKATGIVVVRESLSGPEDAETDVVIDLQGYRQVQDFSCGFVAGLMVLHHFKPSASIDRFYRLVGPDPWWGASTRKVATALRTHGIRVSVRDDLDFEGIAELVTAGSPIITSVDSRTEGEDHWALIYGIGRSPRRVFLAGVGIPYLEGGRILPWGAFRRLWTPPGNGLACSLRPKRRPGRRRRSVA